MVRLLPLAALLLALQHAAAQTTPFCCLSGPSGGVCRAPALGDTFCGASEDRCGRCGGEFSSGKEKGSNGRGTAGKEAREAPEGVRAPKGVVMEASDSALNETPDEAFCCFYSPAVDLDRKCVECTSMADKGHWCSASADRCENNCTGTFCTPASVGRTTPPETTAPTAPATASATKAAAPAAATTTPTTSKRAMSAAAAAGDGAGFCCFYSAEIDDKCGFCSSRAPNGNWCNDSRARCEGVCGGFFCGEDAGDGGTGTPTTDPITPTTRPTTTTAPNVGGGKPLQWIDGTWTTGYWDCMKPSCSWPGKGSMTAPVRACSVASGGVESVSPNTPSVREGGQAVSCTNNQPWAETPSLSFGFAAAAVSGQHGLVGDGNCGQCYVLKFTDQIHPNGGWGGSHPELVGHTIVIQVTNIGYDVSGEHSFDLQLPSAGQGAFTNGCSRQFPGYSSGDFDCDNNYGGCSSKAGCRRQPPALQPGCAWRYDVYKWLEAGGRTNNPYVRFARVQCPGVLSSVTGSVPTDDAQYPLYTSAL